MNEISAANSTLETNRNKEKDPRGVYIGMYTKVLLTKLLKQGVYPNRTLTVSQKLLVIFTVTYAKEKLPLTDDVLKRSLFIDFSKRTRQEQLNMYFSLWKRLETDSRLGWPNNF